MYKEDAQALRKLLDDLYFATRGRPKYEIMSAIARRICAQREELLDDLSHP